MEHHLLFFLFEEKPVFILEFNETVGASEFLAVDSEDDFFVVPFFCIIGAFVPDFYSTCSVFALRDFSFKRSVVKRVVLYRHGQPSDAGGEGRLFGDCPAF